MFRDNNLYKIVNIIKNMNIVDLSININNFRDYLKAIYSKETGNEPFGKKYNKWLENKLYETCVTDRLENLLDRYQKRLVEDIKKIKKVRLT